MMPALLAACLGLARDACGQDDSIGDLRNNVVRVEVEMRSGQVRRGFALAVGEYMNGILLVAPNNLLRDLDVPDNPTRRVSVAYFSTPRTLDEATLLGNSDLSRNIGLILARVRLSNRSFVWASQGCSNTVVGGASAAPVDHRRTPDSFAGGRIRAPFKDGRATIEIERALDPYMGAPIVVRRGFVGITDDQKPRELRIIDLGAIESVVRGWRLPWTLTHREPCSAAVDAKDPNGLVALVSRLFQPGRPYKDIVDGLRPTPSDLAAILHPASVSKVDAHIASLLAERALVPEGVNPRDVSIDQCVEVEPGFQRDREWLTYRVSTAARYCTVVVGSRRYNGFWFVHGHWVWLPEN